MMTDSSSTSNLITFPIIFDPFVGYKKETESDESPRIDEEVEPDEVESYHKNGDCDDTFVSMVCHRVQIFPAALPRKDIHPEEMEKKNMESAYVKKSSHILGNLIKKYLEHWILKKF